MAMINPALITSETRPKIITLCGSTRYKESFEDTARELALKNIIVLMPNVFIHRGDIITDEQKKDLDILHKRKIDLSDEILVINKDGYIGDSTKSEIEYAKGKGIPVNYLFDMDE